MLRFMYHTLILLSAQVEKSKREKWVKEQTRRIKEITMKGLEPEIQKIMDNHKVELEKAQGYTHFFILHDQMGLFAYLKKSKPILTMKT